jgi:outer membrane protein
MKHLTPRLAGAVIAIAFALPANAETLQDALVGAYNTNPTIQATRAQQRATDEGVAQAMSGWRPTLTGFGSYSHLLQDSGIGGANSTANPDVKLNPARIGATLSQPLFRGGRTVAAVNQAKSSVQAGRANLTSTEQDILLETITAYMDVFQDQAVLDLNQRNVEVLTRQLDATRDRFEVGEITRTDVAQAEAALSSSVASRTLAEAQLIASGAEYARLVGSPPSDLIEAAELPALPGNEEETQTMAIAANPFITAAKHTEVAAGQGVRGAIGALLPSADATGEISFTDDASQFATFSRVKQVTGQLTVPVYQGGRAYSQVREARHLHRQRRLEVVESQRQVIEQAASAWANFSAVQSTIESRSEQVRANEIALEGVKQEAIVGSRTTLDVLEEEQRLLDSRVELVRSKRDQQVAAYQLLSVVGGLTAQKLELPVNVYDPNANYDRVRNAWIGFGQSAE